MRTLEGAKEARELTRSRAAQTSLQPRSVTFALKRKNYFNLIGFKKKKKIIILVAVLSHFKCAKICVTLFVQKKKRKKTVEGMENSSEAELAFQTGPLTRMRMYLSPSCSCQQV